MNDPFEVLTTPVPDIDEAAAAGILAQHYGLSGDLAPLDSERDRNYLVTSGDGQKSVLKFANSAEDAAVTAFQTAALLHVAAADPQLAAPRVVKTVRGGTSVEVTAKDGRRHVARVVSWIDGKPLQYVEREPGFAATLGRVAARLGKALGGFSHPAGGYRLLWDLKQAPCLRELLHCVADPRLRALCAERLDRFDSTVAPHLGELPWQVIHNDLNPSNVLVDSREPTRVIGVIDFGDMVHSPRIADLAVASAYLLDDGPDALADMLDFVRAYSSAAPLDAAELEVLFDLTLTRSTMTVLITHWRAARYPENRDYILRNETRARNLLERLHAGPPADVAGELKKPTP